VGQAHMVNICHVLGVPPDRFGDAGWDPAQDVPRVIITISLPEGTDTQLRLTSLDTRPDQAASRGGTRRWRPARWGRCAR
jgi:hypothetical protein